MNRCLVFFSAALFQTLLESYFVSFLAVYSFSGFLIRSQSLLNDECLQKSGPDKQKLKLVVRVVVVGVLFLDVTVCVDVL